MKLLVLDRNTWNHRIVYKLLVLDRNTSNHLIVFKLLVLDKNTVGNCEQKKKKKLWRNNSIKNVNRNIQ